MQETKFLKTKKEKNYTVLDNTFLKDDRLSAQAKGVFAYILYLPEDWCIYQSELVKHFKNGKDSIRAAIKELEILGYVSKERIQGEHGKFAGWQYTVNEIPVPPEPKKQKKDSPKSENPKSENPKSENPPLLNTNVNEILNSSSSEHVDNSKPEKTEEDFIKTKITELFGGEYCFDKTLAPDILSLSKELELTDKQILSFLDYALDRAKKYNPVSLVNIYFTLAKSKNLMYDFKTTYSESEKHKHTEKCPVCKKVIERGLEYCSHCGFDMKEKSNQEEVDKQSQIYLLSPEDKAAFKAEYNAELERQSEFGFDIGFKNLSLKTEFQNNINQIYSKYGIKTCV